MPTVMSAVVMPLPLPSASHPPALGLVQVELHGEASSLPAGVLRDAAQIGGQPTSRLATRAGLAQLAQGAPRTARHDGEQRQDEHEFGQRGAPSGTPRLDAISPSRPSHRPGRRS